MTRRHRNSSACPGAVVAVRRSCGDRGAPEQFLWRNRLYLVREVLQSWERSRPWWGDIRTEPGRPDIQTWRVEAAAGRSDAIGVYELSFDSDADQWFLVRTFD